jgi:diguanylate cyclase (GGDEF)-like protein
VLLEQLVIDAGMEPLTVDDRANAMAAEWQKRWETEGFDHRIPSMQNQAGGRILGFPAIPRLMPFLQGKTDDHVRERVSCESLAQRRVLIVGENVGLVRPVSSEFAIDQASFDDDVELLALEAGQADLVILDGTSDRHRQLCLRLQAGELTQHIPIVVYNQEADSRQEVEAFNMGALDYMHGDQDPVVWLARSRGLARYKQSTDMLGRLARIDGLTEIPNRREFDRILEIEWLRAIRSEEPLSLLMLDVDNFKAYNDGYGHDAGDECLRQVALTIQATMRRSADFAARYGGEEFVCVLPDTDSKGAIALADSIRRNIEGLNIPHEHVNGDRIVTISTGVATFVASARKSPVELVKAADTALYQAKESGRNCVKAA